MKKKRVLFHSTFSRMKTGFSLNAKAVLSYLYKTGKYEVFEYAAGSCRWSDPICKTTPWTCYGAQPDSDAEIAHLNDPGQLRMVHYGAWNIDRVIKEVKPDIYIGCEDIWAFSNYWDKPWWNKIPCVVWTTLDSLPILPQAIEAAPKIENYWVWASFAEKAMKKEGASHVKTIPGMVDTQSFYPIPDTEKTKLRKAFNIDEDCLIFGFVFRNQLRKLVHSVLEGFAQFKRSNKNVKAKVLLHTNYQEQWDIARYIKEFGIDNEDVLTTYYCRACKNFYVTPWVGNGVECKVCKTGGAAGNATIVDGLNQGQLNLVYNLMDAYIHPMTSGGLEMPIAEAMLCGLPVATIPYSCGEEFTQHKFVYPIQFSTYREVGSNFIKANPVISSIKTFMEKVNRDGQTWKQNGKLGRDWAKEYFDNNRIGAILEEFIDNANHNFDFDFEEKLKNPDYPNPEIQDDTEWLIDIYKNILLMDENPQTEGLKNWLQRLKEGVSREQIYQFFVNAAKEYNEKRTKFDVRELINKNDKKKLAYVMPGTFGDCVMSLNILKQLRRDYPGWEIYVVTKGQFQTVFEPFFGELYDGMIPYVPVMDMFRFWEGGAHTEKLVDIAFTPYVLTQKESCYTHNGLDKNNLQRNTIDLLAVNENIEKEKVDWTLQTK